MIMSKYRARSKIAEDKTPEYQKQQQECQITPKGIKIEHQDNN